MDVNSSKLGGFGEVRRFEEDGEWGRDVFTVDYVNELIGCVYL